MTPAIIRPSRRRVLAGAASLAAGLAAPALRAQALEPLTVITPFGFAVDFIEFLHAHAGGHFRAQGFASTVQGGTGSASAVQQTIAGRAKFTRIAGIDLLNAVGKQDLPLVCIGVMYQGSTFHVISHASKPIKSAAELRGKKMGVVSVGGATENFLDMLIGSENIPKDQVPRETVGNSAGALALVQQGRIDGFVASINVVAALRFAKEPVEVWSTDRYAPMPGQVWVCTRETLEREPQVVTRFLRAMRATVTDLVDKPFDPILDAVARDFEVPGLRNRDSLIFTFRSARELWLSEGRENLMRSIPRLWESGARALAAAGIVQIKDVNAVYTNRFIEDVLKG